jgi:tetraacyldisaccharide-1-P 4'-kinase
VNTCDDQAPDFRKEEREKQNRVKVKVISIGSFCFGGQDT